MKPWEYPDTAPVCSRCVKSLAGIKPIAVLDKSGEPTGQFVCPACLRPGEKRA